MRLFHRAACRAPVLRTTRSNVTHEQHAQVEECLELLISTGRIPEATFFARTYAPSQVSRVLALWRDDLKQVRHTNPTKPTTSETIRPRGETSEHCFRSEALVCRAAALPGEVGWSVAE